MDRLKAALASRNPNKARELERLLPGWEIQPLEADDYPPESGATYYENARAKAVFGRAFAEPDAWVLGEDSGIEVVGLDGGPVILLVWLYVMANVIVIGAELNEWLSRRRVSEVAEDLPGLA